MALGVRRHAGNNGEVKTAAKTQRHREEDDERGSRPLLFCFLCASVSLAAIFGCLPSVYLDADEDVLLSWYVSRFLTLRGTAFADPKSYFHRYARLSDSQAIETATDIWNRINLVNLRENILPTRPRADLILKKSESHRVEEVALRRL